MKVAMLFIKSVNNAGARTLPCGTPDDTLAGCDLLPFKTTC